MWKDLWQGVGEVGCPDCGTWLVGVRHGQEGYRCPDCGLGLSLMAEGSFQLEREGQRVGQLAHEALQRSVRWQSAASVADSGSSIPRPWGG